MQRGVGQRWRAGDLGASRPSSCAKRARSPSCRIHLQALALERAWRGDLPGAERLVAEAESISASTGNEAPPFCPAPQLLALQGREAEASALIGARHPGWHEPGQGHRGDDGPLGGRGAEQRARALRGGSGGGPGSRLKAGSPPWLSMWARCELVEAAARTGDAELARDALDGLVATTQPAGSCLALGIEARCRALLEGDGAEPSYREAIDQLDRSGNRTELARAHLLFGEWLRRRGRLREARERLRAAEEMFAEIGMEAFAERTRGELVAAGAKPRGSVRRAARGPHTAGGADRATGSRRPDEREDRRPVVPQSAHR